MAKYRVLVGVHLVLLDAQGRVLLGRRSEEVGVEIDGRDVEFAHVLHSAGRVQMFFVVRRWTGLATNREPEKCSELGWFEPDGLPHDIVDYCRVGIGEVAAGQAFSEYGWEPPTG